MIYVAQKGKANFVDSYLLVHKLNAGNILKIARALTNPVLEEFSIDKFQKAKHFNYAVEIGFKPGVTDNAAQTVKESVIDLLHLKSKANFEIYTSRIFLFDRKLNKTEIEEAALELYNPLIQRAYISIDGKFPNKAPEVLLKKNVPVIKVSLNLPDDELVKIGNLGILDPDGTRRGPLALDLASMKTIQAHFEKLRRDPTDIELEALAQTWSEHCKHTIFANPIDDIKDGLYKTYIKGATNLIRKQKAERGQQDFCVSVFSDNAGGIIFDKDYLITHKVETHNSPSALDPFGGAITGIVGVNRDTIGFGLGAKPVANTYGFCFGYPEDKKKFFKKKDQKQNLTQEMLSPKRIMDGVVRGINVGGNCSGIPTLNGFIKFDDRYRAKPMVFAGTVGLIPRKIKGKFSHIKKAKPDDYIVVVGGRVGLDGIHGATFSSVAIDSNSPSTAVQIGDPITQKKLSDALVKEARDMDLYNSITDNGAGGISCSVAEMAKESGGAKVDLDKVPLKYPGLRPWEIWISESQERMTLAIPKKNWEKFEKLMRSRGVEATIIGEFTNSGKCVVNYKNKKILDIDMEFLHDGLPKHQLRTEPTSPQPSPAKGREKGGVSKYLEKLLADKNISGFGFISQQYDHEVQASSVLKPISGRGRINTDAQVFKPVLNSDKGVILSSSVYPSYGDFNTYDMAACAIDTVVRNIISAGGKLNHLAILDNFCWCSSNDPKRLGQLVDSIKACYDIAVGYGTPFISGKDSMFNDFKGYDEKGNPVEISIPPTLLISGISVMPDLNKTVSPEFKNAGDIIYLLGETKDELGAPKVNLNKNIKTYKALESAIQKELVASSLSLTSGGLAVALAKACIGGMLGCNVSLTQIESKALSVETKLFSESQGRILVSLSPKNAKQFEKICVGITCVKLGKVSEDGKVKVDSVINTDVKKLHTIYHKFSNSQK